MKVKDIKTNNYICIIYIKYKLLILYERDMNSYNSVMTITIDNYHVWRENTNLNTDERKKIYDYFVHI